MGDKQSKPPNVTQSQTMSSASKSLPSVNTVVENQTISNLLHYCGHLSPTKRSYEISPLNFVLCEQRVYTIGSAADSNDLIVPEKEIKDGTIKIYVDKNGKCEIENLTESTIVIDRSLELKSAKPRELKSTEKTELDEGCEIKFGSYCFKFTSTEAPSSQHLKQLYLDLQCIACKGFPKIPYVLERCNHVICQTCFQSLMTAALTKISATNVSSGSLEDLSDTIRLTHERINASSGRPQRRVEEPTVACPKCSSKLTIARATFIIEDVALGEVTKLLDRVSEDRPTCHVCQNQRWIVHGSEYVRCKTCQSMVLCPLCALDSHRNHVIENNGCGTTRQSNREFNAKVTYLKEEWSNTLKSIGKAKARSNKAQQELETFNRTLNSMYSALEQKTIDLKNQYDNIVRMEAPLWTEKAETERSEALRDFEATIEALTPIIDSAFKEIEEKSTHMMNVEKRLNRSSLKMPSNKSNKINNGDSTTSSFAVNATSTTGGATTSTNSNSTLSSSNSFDETTNEN